MAKVLEIRAGIPISPQNMQDIKLAWPEKVHSSSYQKHVTGPSVLVSKSLGILGNSAGYPSHVEDTINRAVLVFNELLYPVFQGMYPEVSSFVRGGLGENLLVSDPCLMPSVVCVGDIFKIGHVTCVVTGPRSPCPKVDAWHGVKGLAQYCKEHGAAGFFLRILEDGHFCVGDDIVLLDRPHPGYTLHRISQGLWGSDDVRDNSLEFLSALAGMEDLIRKHYRDTAATRLERLQQNESKID
jgi:MOSC domain-containing protein YiiM